MKNIIIGKNSTLTTFLKKKIPVFKIISARDERIDDVCNKIIANLNSTEKVNLIFNNFFPSKKLTNLDEKDYFDFANVSLQL